MSCEIEIIEPRSFDATVADELVLRANEVVADKGSFLVGLAGGSTPSSMYRAMTKPPRLADMPWLQTTFFVGDERWVSKTDSRSNRRMVVESLFHGMHQQPKLLDVNTTSATPEAASEEYQKQLELMLQRDGKIDLLILGIGEDGHTASLFPGDPLIHETTRLVAPCIEPESKDVRVTITRALMNKADRVIFIAKGPTKAPVIQRIIEGADALEELPAQLYRTLAGRVTFFLDSSSAAALKRPQR